VSMIELDYKMRDKAGGNHHVVAVAVHDWREGKIVHERFYKTVLVSP
jgi:hypothetical protein